MGNLLYSLPEGIQKNIIKMNPHPLHKIINDAIKYEIEDYNSYIWCDGGCYRDDTCYYYQFKHGKLWGKPLRCIRDYYTFDKVYMYDKIIFNFNENYIRYNDSNSENNSDSDSDSDSENE